MNQAERTKEHWKNWSSEGIFIPVKIEATGLGKAKKFPLVHEWQELEEAYEGHKWRWANGVGIVLPQDVFVLDIDDAEAALKAGLDLEMLREASGIHYTTISGGEHIWFFGESRFSYHSNPLPGVEFLTGLGTSGRYVVAGGSAGYRTPNFQAEPRQMSEQVVSHIQSIMRHFTPTQSTYGLGQRHPAVMSYAAKLRAQGFDGDKLAQSVIDFNNTHCVPPIGQHQDDPPNELQNIITKALKLKAGYSIGFQACFESVHQATQRANQDVLDIVSWGELEAEPIDWLIKPWIPQGYLTIIHATGGTGKTSTVMTLLYYLVTGRKFVVPSLVSCECQAKPCVCGVFGCERKVLYWTDESNYAKVLTPALEHMLRLDKKDAFEAKQRILFLKGRKDSETFILSEDLDLLIKSMRNSKYACVVIDPIAAIIPEADGMNNSVAVRKACAPLIAVANDTNTAIVGVHHDRKMIGLDDDYSERILGSVGWKNIPRSTLAITPCSSGGREGQLMMFQSKTNFARQDGAVFLQIEEYSNSLLDPPLSNESGVATFIGSEPGNVNELLKRYTSKDKP